MSGVINITKHIGKELWYIHEPVNFLFGTPHGWSIKNTYQSDIEASTNIKLFKRLIHSPCKKEMLLNWRTCCKTNKMIIDLIIQGYTFKCKSITSFHWNRSDFMIRLEESHHEHHAYQDITAYLTSFTNS